MIKKLRIRFILASMLALALVLLVILGSINLMSYRKTINDADAILDILSENDGRFPLKMEHDDFRRFDTKHGMTGDPFKGREFSPETPYESRFFSVTLDKNGEAVSIDTGRIAAVDSELAREYALSVLNTHRDQGFRDYFRYRIAALDDSTRVIFLDCSRSLSLFRSTLWASIIIALLGLGAVLILLILFSARIVKPVAESYEKQKRFITDAGHEIKTPLTIIHADVELAELDCGKNEWLQDIRNQAQRLTGLTNDLIFLSRMDEEQPSLQAIEFPLSDVVEETAQSFLALAAQQNKTLRISVEALLSFLGNEKDIRQLTSILLDNALKYAPEHSEIQLQLEKKGRSILLTITNSTTEAIDSVHLNQLFDRFYRGDPARNSAGGYGLGLSIARSIVTAHKGKIKAHVPEENRLSIIVTLPG